MDFYLSNLNAVEEHFIRSVKNKELLQVDGIRATRGDRDMLTHTLQVELDNIWKYNSLYNYLKPYVKVTFENNNADVNILWSIK